MSEQQTIEEILQARGLRNGVPGPHGEWRDNAIVSQRLKVVLRTEMRKRENEKTYPGLDAIHMEALDMITMKLARIVSGDADFADHWRDIAGYATLCAERLGPDMQARADAETAARRAAVAPPAAAAAPAGTNAPAAASTRPVAPAVPPSPGLREIMRAADKELGTGDFSGGSTEADKQ